MKAPSWEHFEHDADMGVRGCGNTLAQAFEQAALAMSAVVADLKLIEPRECFDVTCNASDYELLFVDWLNELIYHMATRKMLFAAFDVDVTGRQVVATVCGEAADIIKHQPAVEVKGATFTELKVYRQSDKSWIAQCVIDV